MPTTRRERRQFVGTCTRCGHIHARIVKVPHPTMTLIGDTMEISCEVCNAVDQAERLKAYHSYEPDIPTINRVTLHIQPR